MIKIENYEVIGWSTAIRGMRNPMNSWDKSDSRYGRSDCCDSEVASKYYIGPNDLDLMKRLVKAGPDHRKFMRMVTVYTDITAPLYWWKEFATYRFGIKPGDTCDDLMDVEMNSCSTMHKIQDKEFTLDDFSTEHLKDCESVGKQEFVDFECGRKYTPMDSLKDTIKMLNKWRGIYLTDNTKDTWWQMIQLLPSSYNQKRTLMLNYEVLTNIYKSRRMHKLDEWRKLCKWIEELPYSELITGGTTNEDMRNTSR